MTFNDRRDLYRKQNCDWCGQECYKRDMKIVTLFLYNDRGCSDLQGLSVCIDCYNLDRDDRRKEMDDE
jgi:hypothetical protein